MIQAILLHMRNSCWVFRFLCFMYIHFLFKFLHHEISTWDFFEKLFNLQSSKRHLQCLLSSLCVASTRFFSLFSNYFICKVADIQTELSSITPSLVRNCDCSTLLFFFKVISAKCLRKTRNQTRYMMSCALFYPSLPFFYTLLDKSCGWTSHGCFTMTVHLLTMP